MSDRYVATLLAAVLMKRIVLVILLKLKIYKMETTNKLISQGYNHRKYFFADYDEARKFYYLFDGEFAYAENGYTVTI